MFSSMCHYWTRRTLKITWNKFNVQELPYSHYTLRSLCLLDSLHFVYFRVCSRELRRAEIARKSQMAFRYRGLRVTRANCWKIPKNSSVLRAEHVRLVSYNRLMAYSIIGYDTNATDKITNGENAKTIYVNNLIGITPKIRINFIYSLIKMY